MGQNDETDDQKPADIEQGLRTLFAAFGADHDRRAQQALQDLAGTEFIAALDAGLQAGDPKPVKEVMRRLEMAVRSAIKMWRKADGAAVSPQDVIDIDLQFLFLHSNIVESHVRHAFERFEGMMCCADKTRTVMRKLTDRLVRGTPIGFDYGGEYTFHLPAAILTSEAEILGFFRGIRDLHYGRPEQYFAAIAGMVPQSEAYAARLAAEQPVAPPPPAR